MVALLRAGKIQATSKTQVIDSATSVEAFNTFSNNNLFRSASFQPKIGIGFEHIVDAGDHFNDTFGKEVSELEQGVVAREIRAEVERHEQEVRDIHTTLVQNRLPGAEVLETALDQMAVIRRGTDDQVVLTFNAAYKALKEANKRAAELSQALTPSSLHDLQRARRVLDTNWPFLRTETDLDDSERADAQVLEDLVAQETFFRHLPEIDQRARTLEEAYARRLSAAVKARCDAYEQASAALHGSPGWEQLTDDQQRHVSQTVESRRKAPDGVLPSIPLLREETANCQQVLNHAIEQTLQVIDGNRLVAVDAAGYFVGGIENEEQLEAATRRSSPEHRRAASR